MATATHAAPEAATLDGLAQVVLACGIGMAGIGTVIHGTTLATNALIERRGAHTALITTQGFRGVIEMRTENRFELHDLNVKLPAAPVARRDRHVVRERIDAQGRVLHPLDEAQVRRLVALISWEGYEGVAVGLIHSYLNAAHERRIRDVVLEHLPGLAASLSSEVSPQMRECQRFNTVCASVDAMDQIRVSPRSAGSEPGPACFGRGGTEPTVTDADLAPLA